MPGIDRAHRGGRALLLQAARVQGRVRGRAALHRDRLHRSASPRSSRATTSSSSTSRRRSVDKPDPRTGEPRKRAYGPWMLKAFRVLAKMRRLRGTALDVFGSTAERRMERRLIGDYEAMVDELLGKLAPHNHALAVELASIPEHIRGYGHVKERHLRREGARGGAARQSAGPRRRRRRSRWPPRSVVDISSPRFARSSATSPIPRSSRASSCGCSRDRARRLPRMGARAPAARRRACAPTCSSRSASRC